MSFFSGDIKRWMQQVGINRKFTHQHSQQIRINNNLINAIKRLEKRIVGLEKIIKRGES